MVSTPTIAKALSQYFEERQHHLSAEQAKQEKSETMSAFYLLAEAWGFKRSNPGGKITAADQERATEFFQTVHVQRLLKAKESLDKVFDQHKKSPHSRRTYGNRLNQFLTWAKAQVWWFGAQQRYSASSCCPSRPVSGIRSVNDIKLTARKGGYTQYRLRSAEQPEFLKHQLADYFGYLTDPTYVERVREPVKASTARNYRENAELMLGYLHRCEGVLFKELALERLIPVIQLEDIEHLPQSEQKRLWRKHGNELKAFVARYFKFMHEENQSISPRTRLGRLNALESIAFYLYRHQVQGANEYNSIPIFMVLKELINQQAKEVTRWRHSRRKVAEHSLKWPDPVEGETALGTVRTKLVEPLRLMCRPRYRKSALRPSRTMAMALQKFLKWALLTVLPARRQQDHRTLRVSLCCDIQRPDCVPPDGIYFPLPPNGLRQRGKNGLLCDNYLARVYRFRGKSYPQGVWILTLEDYKTDVDYGTFEIPIPNPRYEDGTCLYDYFDWYFCGLWIASNTQRSHAYGWWDTAILGQRGEWIAPGLLAFDPNEEWPHEVPWRWQYAFVLPNTGKLAGDSSYGASFNRTAKQYLKKSISPHTLRSMWATWGHQVGLNEQQMRSLAYAMGHSLETLREIYESCDQEEKLRPIHEVINAELLEGLQSAEIKSVGLTDAQVVAYLRRLTPEERQRIIDLAS